MNKILLVDDEERMLDLISIFLTPAGFTCIKKYSGTAAIDYIKNEDVDLVLLDIMMPDKDGWETCQEIRLFTDVPIILLTAKGEKDDVVKGLNVGADDYIVKPFHEKELLARINARLRRGTTEKETKIDYKGLLWNQTNHELTYNGTSIILTPREFALLGVFLKNVNRVYSREELLSHVWGMDSFIEDRTVDTHIRNIREKLRANGFPINEHLKTVWGIGYKWID